METNRVAKTSSSDDEELLLDSEELGVKKKHFLDYEYDPQITSSDSLIATTSVDHGKINLSATNRKITTDRPSSTKMAMEQQLTNNSGSVESVYSILSMFGGQNNSSDIASKFLELSKNREMCTGIILVENLLNCQNLKI